MWGSRLAQKWARQWIEDCTLPESSRGNHAKTWSILSDPAIREELQNFLCSNKWSMNPAKLAAFTEKTLLPAEAEKYVQDLVENEMPEGLRQYMEVVIFPCIQLKTTKGISIKTACHVMHEEGFHYTEHKKAVFYNGHERPDVVGYRQDVFIPRLQELCPRFVHYQPDNLKQLADPVLTAADQTLHYGDSRKLVLVAHDESTNQTNDGPRQSWVYKGEYALENKGLGRGMHQSDVICSTIGWMQEASQSLEYGKNYEGYWNGEMFVKQVRTNSTTQNLTEMSQLKEKIIPTFKKHHNKDKYQAVFLINNSQGHSAYPPNAL